MGSNRSYSDPDLPFELRHLAYFCAVVREGGFANAALELRTSRGSLRRQVQGLERLVGESFFQTLPDGTLAIEPAGRHLFESSTKLREAVLRMHEGVTAERSKGRRMTLAVSRSLGASDVVPKACGWLKGRVADSLSFVSLSTVRCVRRVAGGRADLAIIGMDVQHRDLVTYPLMRLAPVAVVSQDHPLADAELVTWEMLREHPQVRLWDRAWEAPGAWRPFWDVDGEETKEVFQTKQAFRCFDHVRSGRYVFPTVTPHPAFLDPDARCIPLVTEQPMTAYLVWNRTTPDETLNRLCQEIRSVQRS